MTTDVFGLLGALDKRFFYSEAQWQRVAATLKDAETATVLYDEMLLDAAQVPLRRALEVELSIYLVKLEFQRRYPSLTKYQIATKLQDMKRAVEYLLALIRQPEVSLYLVDWGPHRGGPSGTVLLLEKLLSALSERAEWLATS